MKRPTLAERPNREQAHDDPPHRDNTSTGGEIPVLRWATRRKMAWRCLTILVIATVAYWFVLPLWFNYWALPTTWLTIIGDSYFWFATTMAAVVVTYMGVNSNAMPWFGRNTNRGGSSRSSRHDEDSEDEPDDEIYK